MFTNKGRQMVCRRHSIATSTRTMTSAAALIGVRALVLLVAAGVSIPIRQFHEGVPFHQLHMYLYAYLYLYACMCV